MLHSQGSHDAVVLDFWVRAKKSEGGIVGNVQAASNEGSPAAIKLHGAGAKDMFHFEVDGACHDCWRCATAGALCTNFEWAGLQC
jgi:hypothetical protein